MMCRLSYPGLIDEQSRLKSPDERLAPRLVD
jgi:hypothetical protein